MQRKESNYFIHILVKMGENDYRHIPQNVSDLDQLFIESQLLVLILF